MTTTTAKSKWTVGDCAEDLHEQIVNLISGRRSIGCDELKRETVSMSGSGGTSANALASVAIHQLWREGRIVRSKSGKSWRLPSGITATLKEARKQATEHGYEGGTR